MSNVQVRPWTEADLPTVGRLHAASRHHAYADLVDAGALARVTSETQEATWRQRWVRLREGAAQGRPCVTLLAEQETEAVGFGVAFALPEPDRASQAELNALHVLPQHHRAGVGRALMDAVVAAMRTWDVRTAHLLVLEGNTRAESFYRRTGWSCRGRAGTHDVGGAQVPVLRYELRLR
jgi:GNAT superfamily N-acetyltransferase